MKINRNTIIKKMAEQMTNDADLDTIQKYFYDGQVNYLDDLSDVDLLSEAAWIDFVTTEYEQVE